MARFPRTEPEVIALAQAMVSGLTANAVLYAAPHSSVVRKIKAPPCQSGNLGFCFKCLFEDMFTWL